MNRSGLKKVSKTVRGKHGSVRRSYWVKAQEGAKNVGQKIWHNKGKIALGFAGATIAALAIRNRGRISAVVSGYKMRRADQKMYKAAQGVAEGLHKNQKYYSASANAMADATRAIRHKNGRAPLQLEAGPWKAPHNPPNPPPAVGLFHKHEYVNPAVQAQGYRSDATNWRALNRRGADHISNRAPLQFGPGGTEPSPSSPKPKRSRKKK